MNKKGIHPILSTVLLLGIAIVIGGLVITWGGRFFEGTTSNVHSQTELTISCSEVEFEIQNIKCSDQKLIEITILGNTGRNIPKWIIRVTNQETETKVEEVTQELKPFTTIKIAFTDEFEGYENIKLVEAISKININNRLITCKDQIARYAPSKNHPCRA